MWTPISVHIWVPSRLQRIMPITLNLARCWKHRYCFSMETLGWLQLGVSLKAIMELKRDSLWELLALANDTEKT